MSRGAKLDYMTVTVIEQYFHIPCSLCVEDVAVLHGGCLDSFSLVASLWGCTCQAVRGFPTFAPCLEHMCAGWEGGSVANMGLVLLCRRGLYIYALELCYL